MCWPTGEGLSRGGREVVTCVEGRLGDPSGARRSKIRAAGAAAGFQSGFGLGRGGEGVAVWMLGPRRAAHAGQGKDRLRGEQLREPWPWWNLVRPAGLIGEGAFSCSDACRLPYLCQGLPSPSGPLSVCFLSPKCSSEPSRPLPSLQPPPFSAASSSPGCLSAPGLGCLLSGLTLASLCFPLGACDGGRGGVSEAVCLLQVISLRRSPGASGRSSLSLGSADAQS